MSKNKKAVNDQLNEQQPTVYDDLLKNGTAILEAPTREALAELVDNIQADVKYCVGAVGQNPTTGTFTLRVDKI
jgi:hypothetical protein